MRFPLRYQILIPTVTIVLAALAASTAITAVMATRRTERNIAEQLRRIGGTLQASAFPLTDNVLQKMQGLSGAEFVLADRNGRVLAASRHLHVVLKPPDVAVGAHDAAFDAKVDVGAQRYFDKMVRITLAGETSPSAWLHMLFSEQDLQQARREAALPSLLVGAIGVVVTVGFSFELSRRMTRPIERLQAQMARLAAGDFEPTPLPDRNDELRDLAGSVNTLAAQLKQLNLAIRRGERLAILGQLSGGIAHQMRNGITGARMAIELHERGCRGGNAEGLQVALRQLQLIEEQIQGLLTTGRQRELQPAECSLNSVVAEVERLVSPSARHRRIALQFSLQGDCQVFGAADELRQLILNLVINAIEAAARDGRVRVVMDRLDNDVRLRVFDTGSGPPAHLREQIFEPFVTGKAEGIGLGLAVAQQTVAAHHGHLRCDRVGEETCFELCLPRCSAAARSSDVTVELAKSIG